MFKPNQHIGETKKMGIMEDDYTIAQRRERELAELKTESQGDFFTDKDGHKTPIQNLNGQTEALLRQAREDIKKEIADNKEMAEEFPEEKEETIEAIKNEELKKRAFEARKTSIHIFSNKKGQGRYLGGDKDGERIGQKPGLYKDYQPNLNPGAPGNREERYRESRRLAEKTKGEQPFEEPIFEDFLPEIKDED